MSLLQFLSAMDLDMQASEEKMVMDLHQEVDEALDSAS
jgi:hypothetical protein